MIENTNTYLRIKWQEGIESGAGIFSSIEELLRYAHKKRQNTVANDEV